MKTTLSQAEFMKNCEDYLDEVKTFMNFKSNSLLSSDYFININLKTYKIFSSLFQDNFNASIATHITTYIAMLGDMILSSEESKEMSKRIISLAIILYIHKNKNLHDLDVNSMQDMISEFSKNMLEILKNKGDDYASSNDPFKNFKLSSTLCSISVIQSIFIRLLDKISRMNNFISKNKDMGSVTNETIYDTIYDIVGYLLLILNAYELQPESYLDE